MSCRFEVCEPAEWLGRYDRIPGDQSVFHLRWRAACGCFWPMAEWRRGSEKADCWFEDKEAIRQMRTAIAEVQRRFNGNPGGSFVINEWGQVIVPSVEGDRRRFLVGSLSGSWCLVSPDDERELVSLEDDRGLRCGDPWNRPYVGIPYHLSERGWIYFVHRAPHGESVVYPPLQDEALIESIRSIRRRGPVKFIVNPFGLVLTKRPTQGWLDEEEWEPVYLGRINYRRWFPKEVG